ncbi:MAG: hypothetical protein WCL34_04515 [Methylococcaceae bacterium]
MLNLDSTNATNLGTLFTKEAASADDTVNATNMNSTALNVLAANTAKIASISGVMGLTAGQSDVQLTALFGKEAAPSTTGGVTINTGDDTVVATNMTSAALDVLALNVAKIQTITGTMALTSTGVTVGQDATELTSLFSKDDNGNDTIAVAATTSSAVLNIIAANAGKIADYVPVNGTVAASGGITGAMALTSGQSDTQLNALFSKDDAGNDTVVATGMNSTALNAVAANTAKIADAGISGVMALTGGTLGQNADQLTALFSKEAAPTGTAIGDDTVVATGMNSAALDVVAANTVKIASLSGELALTSGQSDVELTALFGKEGTAAPADDTVNATGVSSAALNVLAANTAKIASITGVLGLSGQSDVQLTALFNKEATNAPADDIVNVTGMNAAALNVLLANTAKIGSITGVLGLSGQNDSQLNALFNKEATNAPADDIVNVTGMDAAALNVLLANAAKIDNITGVMSLNAPVAAVTVNGVTTPAVSGQNATQLSALFDKEGTAAPADDIVNATGMNAASLNVLAANSAKIGSITGSMALSGGTAGQNDSQLSALFSKDDGIGNDTVVVTGMNAGTLGIVAANVVNIKTVGLTGVMAVDSGLSATQLTALFRKTGGAPDDTVNAANLTYAQLTVIAANTAKISAITGVMDLTSDLNASQLTNLFSKDDTATAGLDSVVADSMDSSSLDVLALNTAKIGTIDGVMTLTAVANGATGQDATELTKLFSKDNNAANDTVDVTSATPSAVLNVLAANTAHIDEASIRGVMALTSGQDSTALTNLFSKDDAGNDTVLATGMNASQLNAVAAGADHIADESITGVMALTSGQDSTALTNLFSKDDAAANATVNATGMNPAAVDVIAAHTDNINTLTGALVLTGHDQDAPELTALLGKYTGTTASVVATEMNPEALDALASTIFATPAKIKAAGISGEMALTSAQDSTELTKLFSKDDGTADATVNASGMAASALNVIASNAGKIHAGGISGVMELNNSVNAANLTALFGLDAGGNTASDLDMVDATGMNSEALGVLAVNTANIGEIRGAMTLTADQSTTAMGDLFSKDDEAANDIVIADGMDSDQLNLVALHTAKIDSIDGVMALTSGQDASTFTTLFSKDDTGENDTVVATDLHEELNIVAQNIDKVARITGDLGLSGQNAEQLTALFSKYSGGTTAVVNAAGMDADALNVVALNTGKIAATSITGEMHLTSAQDAAALTALFAKDDATDNDTVNATGMDTAAIAVLVSNTAKIAHITGELALSSSQNSTALDKLFALDDATANDVVDATGMNAAALHVLTANTGKIGSIFGEFTLDNSFTADEIAALDHLYVGEQLVEVNAATMDAAQQAAIETPRVATHHITHLALDLGATEITGNIGVNLLAKAAAATVVATGATPDEIHNGLVMNIANVTGISGEMHLAGDVDTTAALADLFGKYTGSSATFDASPETDSVALNVLADNTAKIADHGITGVMALTGGTLGQDSTALTNLFSKDDATTNDVVDATDMNAAAIDVIATNINKIAAHGITGALTLFSGQDSTAMTALFALDDEMKASPVLDDNGNPTFIPVDSAGHTVVSEESVGFDHFEPVMGDPAIVPNDIIVATDMVKAQLDVVVANMAKIDHIEGAMPLTSGQSVDDLNALFSKYMGNTAIVDAANLDAAQLSAIAHNIEKIAAHGITGVMELTSDIEVPMLTALFTKDDTTADATVVATGMNAAALNVLAGHTANIDAAGITGELALSHAQTPDALDALLALYGGTTASIDATNVAADDLLVSLGVSGNPAKIAVITGELSLTSAQDATALTTLFAKDDDEANDVVNVSSMDAASLNLVAANIDKIAHINGDIILVHGAGTSGQNADQLSALFSKYEGSGHATVNAADMTADELNVLAANAGKINEINGIMALTDAQDAGDLHLLFSKDDATADATVDATGMDAAAVQELASNHAKIDTNGITGALIIDTPESLVPTDITHLLGKTATAATVTVNASHMDNAEVTAVAANLAKVDNFIIGGVNAQSAAAGGAVIHAADITGLTLKVTGSANGRTLTVNATDGADTIDLGHVTLSNAMTSIVGGNGIDTITLKAGSGTDIVILSSTDRAANSAESIADSITGFNKSHVVKFADKIGFDAHAVGAVHLAVVDGDGNTTTPAIMINDHGVTSVKLGAGTGDVVITSAVTTIADNASALTAAAIATTLNAHKHLVVGNSDNTVYIAIDNGVDTAIARIHSASNTTIETGDITIVGTLVAITDATSLNATNFVF